MAPMFELFELLDRVMGSRRKVSRNREHKGDLRESHCEFSGPKCKCVHLKLRVKFEAALEAGLRADRVVLLILSLYNYVVRSDDVIMPKWR